MWLHDGRQGRHERGESELQPGLGEDRIERQMLQCHLPWDLFDDHNGACGECLALLKAIEVHHHVHVVVRAGVELQGERRVRGVSVLLDLRCCAVRHACTCLGVG